MESKGRLWFSSFLLIISSTTFAKSPTPPTYDRTVIPVKVSVSNAYWVETISICNTTANPIPLTDIEFNFNYAAKMPSNIWGEPWSSWRLVSQNGEAVVLLGGSSFTLPVDPNCQNPITIKFNAAPTLPRAAGPFVFKANIGSEPPPPIGIGNMNISLQAAPASGLSNPEVTVQGVDSTVKQKVSWGGQWQLNQLKAGPYTISAEAVTNGTDSFQAIPITATVNDNATTNVTIKYEASVPPASNIGNGTWAYDTLYNDAGKKIGQQPGLFASNISQYNNLAQPGHRITQIFSYGGDMEMYCAGSGGSSTGTPCTAATMSVFYNPASTQAYKAQNSSVEMHPIVDGVVGGEYLKTFNTLTQAQASVYADNVAKLYCADKSIAGVQFDLEPFDLSKPGQAFFFAQIAKNFAGQHDGAGKPDPYGCVDSSHPKGRIFSVFTYSGKVNAKMGEIFNAYHNGVVIDSLYDLGSKGGGSVNTVAEYTTLVKNEVNKLIANANTFNVKYQFGIPAAASVHEFESVSGNSTGFKQIDYVKAAMNAINASKARKDPLFVGIDLWGWNSRMFWGGKEFTPAIPDATVQAYLATTL